MGNGDFLVAESDESDGSFLLLNPFIGVLTNVDREHLNHYGSFEELKKAFRTFLEFTRRHRVVCMDDQYAIEVSRGLDVLSYSVGNPEAEVYAENLVMDSSGARFVCHTPWGKSEVIIQLAGMYNVSNSLAAVTAACLAGCSLDKAVEALSTFKGVERRLTIRGFRNGAVLVDDYAHHPTEIKNVLQAARQKWPGKRIIAVFQPHRYSRMKLLWRDFLNAFQDADEVWVTDVYAAGEINNGFDMQKFLEEFKKSKI